MELFSGIQIENLGMKNFHNWKQIIELLLALKDLNDHLITFAPTDRDGLSKWKKCVAIDITTDDRKLALDILKSRLLQEE